MQKAKEMIKNILVPTNYSVESLNIVKCVLQEKAQLNEDFSYHIHFLAGYHRGDSIRELLFFSEVDIINKIKEPTFNEACNILQNKYPYLIEKISFDIHSGYFQDSFDHYLKLNNIDEIYYTDLKLEHKDRNVFDLTKFIVKSKVNFHQIHLEKPIYRQPKGLLAQFFT